MIRYYAPGYIHEDGNPSHELCEKYVYLADDVEEVILSREQIEHLKTLTRIVRRYAASCDPVSVLDKDAAALEAVVAMCERLSRRKMEKGDV
jgi:hypothetical protein